MRHLRVRRRFKIALILFFALSMVLFFEARVESFAPQLKLFAESRIEGIFDNKVRLSVGSIEGGVLHPLTISDCRLFDEGGKSVFPSLVIESIRSNYRIWDVIFTGAKYVPEPLKASGEPCVDVKFTTSNQKVAGFIRMEGNTQHGAIKGYFDLSGKGRVGFNGVFDDSVFKGEAKWADVSCRINGRLSPGGELILEVGTGHITRGGLDVACDVLLRNIFRKDDNNSGKNTLEGQFATQNLIINYKPFMEIKGSYEIADNIFHIADFELGKCIRAYGKISLYPPYDMDITVIVDNANLAQILHSFGITRDELELSGILNGKFELKGPIASPRVAARIEAREGDIAGVDFNYLTAGLKGEGPILRIEESRITRESGYFVLAGELNMAKAGKGNIFQDVKMASDDMAIMWDGMDAMKLKDVEQLTMEKKMSEDVKVSFKKFVNDKMVDESIRDKDEVALRYKLYPNENLRLSVGKDGDFLGWEHKDKF